MVDVDSGGKKQLMNVLAFVLEHVFLNKMLCIVDFVLPKSQRTIPIFNFLLESKTDRSCHRQGGQL